MVWRVLEPVSFGDWDQVVAAMPVSPHTVVVQGDARADIGAVAERARYGPDVVLVSVGDGAPAMVAVGRLERTN